MNDHIEIKSVTWLQPILKPGGLAHEVAGAVKNLTSIKFKAIAFTGMSGSVLASAVALTMNKLLYCVRKQGENRHSNYEVEGPLGYVRYVIIDDLIQTGDTIRRIVKQVGLHSDNQATLVGIWLYREQRLITSVTDLESYAS